MTRRPRAAGQRARFTTYKADPAASVGLKPDHPAVLEGRTLFPGRVSSPYDSPRYLVDGTNNAKIGGEITKGPWKGMPVFTLTLEERATCPRSCLQWSGCYGNSMNWPRRQDVRHEDFIAALAAEVITVARQNVKGFVVRLHVLGDFYSVRYVDVWRQLLDMLPNLHVYGYTARRADLDDAESQEIAAAIGALTADRWDRFAIRTSHDTPGRDRTIVVDSPDVPDGVIVCPAQLDQTACCSSCGLCWSPNFRDTTVAFLRHGIKTTKSPRAAAAGADAAVPALPKASGPDLASIWSPYTVKAARTLAGGGATIPQIAEYVGEEMLKASTEACRQHDITIMARGRGRPEALDSMLVKLRLPLIHKEPADV